MKFAELSRCAQMAVCQCMEVKPGEQVLIVTDTFREQSISLALLGATLGVSAEGIVMVYSASEPNRREPPAAVAEAMKVADAVFCYTSSSLSHSKARVNAQKAKARIISMPGVTEDNFLRTMAVDLEAVARLTTRVSEEIAQARMARVTSSLGTDLTMRLGNEPVVADGKCHQPGELDFIPFGCNVIVPQEGSTSGKIVVDGAVTGIGRLTTPIVLSVTDGRVTDIQGGREAHQLRKILEELDDENAYNCPAEWGVGTNPGAKLEGADPAFEGERIYGWTHMSLGNNSAFPGGTVQSKIHLDLIVTDPVLELDGRVVLANRHFQLR